MKKVNNVNGVFFYSLSVSAEEHDFSDYIDKHSGDETVVYKTADGNPLLLSLFYPSNYCPEKKYPVFIFIHGGGWSGRMVFSDQTEWAGDYLGFLARYYAEKGYVSVSIDYRLMKENGTDKIPELADLYEDCADAVEYLSENKESYGLDFSETVLLGESAGGYLAGALSALPYRERHAFQKVILVNAITDLSDPRWMNYVPEQSTHSCLQGKSRIEMARALSPVCHVTEKYPDTLLIHGTEDTVVSPEHSVSFYDRVCQKNRKTELHMIENTSHAFLLAEYMMQEKKSLQAASLAVDIIDNWLFTGKNRKSF